MNTRQWQITNTKRGRIRTQAEAGYEAKEAGYESKEEAGYEAKEEAGYEAKKEAKQHCWDQYVPSLENWRKHNKKYK